jgi:hypothetical protein
VAQGSLVRRAASRPRFDTLASQRRVSLCETLDRVLNKGAVVAGDIVISVAGVDLLYLGVNLVLTSVETMRHWEPGSQPAKAPAPALEEHRP